MENKKIEEVKNISQKEIAQIKETKKEKKTKKSIFRSIEIKNVIPFLMFCGINAISYSYLFNVMHIPKMSFLIFISILIVSSLLLLEKYKMIKNKKAYLILIPVIMILVGNVIFANNAIINICSVSILLILFYIKIMNNNYKDIYGLQLLLPIIDDFFNNVDECISSILLPKFKKIKGNDVMKVIIGLGIALPIVMIILQLLLSSDQVFAELIYDFNVNFEITNEIKYVIRFIVSFYILQIIFLFLIKIKDVKELHCKQIKGDNIIVGTVLISINLLFALFCYVQLRYLVFGGGSELPGGITYSEYARSGFFQLLFVTVINYAVILILTTKFTNILKNRFINILMILLGMFTILLIFSSFYRMNMYISAYGYTILRLQVITFLFMELLILIATIIKLIFDKIDISKIVFVFLMLGLLSNTYLCNDFIATKLNFGTIEDFEIRNDEITVDNISICYENSIIDSPAEFYDDLIDEFEWRESSLLMIIYHLKYKD